ncbi:hypothetical protein Y032_0099g3171 [Ancylostoma ceylanicum]|uniref:Uncharacterized protein n=1 Tax=Ancylostoma ceylanicum TaxID=53326 RepID=A0A016TIM5_9BILA|nr:hypothetical protein Y032_0099g3171 [Ancylostoma ceylanicum]
MVDCSPCKPPHKSVKNGPVKSYKNIIPHYVRHYSLRSLRELHPCLELVLAEYCLRWIGYRPKHKHIGMATPSKFHHQILTFWD